MRFKFLLSLAAFSCITNVFAQEVKLVDLLAEESKKTLAKQKEEISKSTPAAPVVPLNVGQIPALPKPKPIVNEPRTLSVFGVAPDYMAEMEINGKFHLLKVGQSIYSYKVASITPSGVNLLSMAPPKKPKPRKKVSPPAQLNGENAPQAAVVKKVSSPTKKKVAKPLPTTPTFVTRFYPLQQN